MEGLYVTDNDELDGINILFTPSINALSRSNWSSDRKFPKIGLRTRFFKESEAKL